jgi:hypothetical protein
MLYYVMQYLFFPTSKILWFNPALFKSMTYLLCRVNPMLADDIPDLLPELRPYQRRAAYWMVQREKGDSRSLVGSGKSSFLSPLCLPVDFLDTRTKMFYNPFRYHFLNCACVLWKDICILDLDLLYLQLSLHMLTFTSVMYFFSVEMFLCSRCNLHHMSSVEFLLVGTTSILACICQSCNDIFCFLQLHPEIVKKLILFKITYYA